MFRSIVFLPLLATIATITATTTTTSVHSEKGKLVPVTDIRVMEPCEAGGNYNGLNDLDDEKLTNELIRELVRQKTLAMEAQKRYLKVLSVKQGNDDAIESSDGTLVKEFRPIVSPKLSYATKARLELPIRSVNSIMQEASRLASAASRKRPVVPSVGPRDDDIARLIARYELKARYPSLKDIDADAKLPVGQSDDGKSVPHGKTVSTTERNDNDDDYDDNSDENASVDATTVKPRSIDSVKNKNVNKNANTNTNKLKISEYPARPRVVDEFFARDTQKDVVPPKDQKTMINVLKLKEAMEVKTSTARRPIVILTTAAPKMEIVEVKPNAESDGKRPTNRPNKSQRGQRRRKHKRRPSQTNKEQERPKLRPMEKMTDETTLENPSGSRDKVRDQKGYRVEDKKTSDVSVSSSETYPVVDFEKVQRLIEHSKHSSNDGAKKKKPQGKDDEEDNRPLPKNEKPSRVARPTVGPSKPRHIHDKIREVDLEAIVTAGKSKNLNVNKNKNINQVSSSRRSLGATSDNENNDETPRPRSRNRNKNVNMNRNVNVNRNSNKNHDVHRVSGSHRHEVSEDDAKLSPKAVESILREVQQLRKQLAMKEADTRRS